MKNTNLIAPYGLDCKGCDIRFATVDDDYELRARTGAKWRKMYDTDAYERIIGGE